MLSGENITCDYIEVCTCKWTKLRFLGQFNNFWMLPTFLVLVTVSLNVYFAYLGFSDFHCQYMMVTHRTNSTILIFVTPWAVIVCCDFLAYLDENMVHKSQWLFQLFADSRQTLMHFSLSFVLGRTCSGGYYRFCPGTTCPLPFSFPPNPRW